MKKLTRERVVPIISAKVSCEILGMYCSGSPGLPKLGHQQQNPRQALFAEVEKLIDQIGLCACCALTRTSRTGLGIHAPRASPRIISSRLILEISLLVTLLEKRHSRQHDRGRHGQPLTEI